MYQTTFMGVVSEHYWWNGKRWTKSCKAPCSSNRTHRNAKTAWREFNQMRKPGFTLLRFYKRQGKLWIKEWYWEE